MVALMAEQALRAYTPPYAYRNSRSPLSRVIDEMPYLARCSDNKTAGLVRPREFAVAQPYVQVNRTNVVSWLVFDLDHANAAIWQDEELPAPNMVVRNRTSGKAHLFYAIEPVLTGENARPRPIAYMKAVYDSLSERLEADKAYSGPVAKTPGHPWWETTEFHNHVHDLGELSEHLELKVKPYWSKEPDLDAVAHSRHCTLFEKLRYFAYSIVNDERRSGSYSSFCRRLRQFADQQNRFRKAGFTENLRVSQVRATVKSVSRWTWTRYTGRSDCHRGVMRLDKNVPLGDRQRLSAKRTHEVRRTASERKVRLACLELRQKGEKLTAVAVARAAGVTRQTVARYRHVLTEKPPVSGFISPKVVSFPQQAMKTEFVTFGVYQISALFSEFPVTNNASAVLDWIQWLRQRWCPD